MDMLVSYIFQILSVMLTLIHFYDNLSDDLSQGNGLKICIGFHSKYLIQ